MWWCRFTRPLNSRLQRLCCRCYSILCSFALFGCAALVWFFNRDLLGYVIPLPFLTTTFIMLIWYSSATIAELLKARAQRPPSPDRPFETIDQRESDPSSNSSNDSEAGVALPFSQMHRFCGNLDLTRPDLQRSQRYMPPSTSGGSETPAASENPSTSASFRSHGSAKVPTSPGAASGSGSSRSHDKATTTAPPEAASASASSPPRDNGATSTPSERAPPSWSSNSSGHSKDSKPSRRTI